MAYYYLIPLFCHEWGKNGRIIDSDPFVLFWPKSNNCQESDGEYSFDIWTSKDNFSEDLALNVFENSQGTRGERNGWAEEKDGGSMTITTYNELLS